MKRALTAVAALFLGWRLWCALSGRHDPRRAGIFGGFRCSKCGTFADSLAAFDGPLSGYVSPGARKVFDRNGGGGRGDITRTTELPPS